MDHMIRRRNLNTAKYILWYRCKNFTFFLQRQSYNSWTRMQRDGGEKRKRREELKAIELKLTRQVA